jgi:hypothetical protein
MITEKETLEELVAATAKMLLHQDHMTEASLVTHSRVSIHAGDSNNYGDIWLIWFHLPVDVYSGLDGRGSIEQTIDRAMDEVVDSMFPDDRVRAFIKMDTKLDYHEDWRREMAQILSGETISNQGRVRSTNVATIQHDGLLFRSEPEVMFYRAAKKKGLVIAPLPVFLQGGANYSRAEPDFVVIRNGITLIVELDGRRVHRESPLDAQKRLAFLKHQGIETHRITANDCLTEENAAKCVNEVIGVIDQMRIRRSPFSKIQIVPWCRAGTGTRSENESAVCRDPPAPGFLDPLGVGSRWVGRGLVEVWINSGDN